MKKTNVIYSAVLFATSVLPAISAVPEFSNDATVKRQELKIVKFEDAIKKPRMVKDAVSKASVDDFKGRKFYGAMVYSSTWDNLQITDVPYGIYEFTIGDEVTSENKYKAISLEFMAGAESRGYFYGVRPVSMFGALTGVAYNVIDVVNYKEVQQKFADESTLSYEDIGSVMAYDYTDNTIYALQYNADLTGLYWATFDRDELAFNTVANWRQKVNIVTLSVTPDGKVYGISAEGDLYEINKKNGNAQFVGSTGVNVQNYSQSAVYDNRTGTLLWTAVTSTGSELYSVDIETGKASYITDMQNEEQVVGTYIVDNLAKDDAPAAISDLKLTYSTPGSLSATISFTIPSRTFGDSPIAGNMDYTVFVDGDVVKEESAAGGTKISIPVELSEANHYVAVALKNAAGFAPYCNLHEFAGNDIPAAVTNLKFEVADGISNVTWDTPVGANDGYIDSDKLFYRVYRMPDNVLVADNLKVNSFSETLPDEMRAYSYKVVAYNGAGREGVAAISNEIIAGMAYGVPYNHVIDSEEVLDLFTILDLNKDNTTWKYNNGEVDVWNGTVTDYADDWLITPKIKLQAGKLYRFVANFRTWMDNYSEDLRVAYGKEINQENMDGFTTIADWKDLKVTVDFENKYAEFSVPEDGEYHIGLGYLSSKNTGSLVRLKSVGVELLANLSAPGKITDLAMTTFGDEMKAEISFSTPTTDLANAPISNLTAVKVYRNDEKEPVKVFNAPAVGEKLEWIDDNVPQVGVNTYYVVPESEEGEGYKASVSKFVGVYSANDYHDTFENKSVLDFYTYEVTGVSEGSAETFTYNQSNKVVSFQYYCMQPPVNAWIYSPTIKFDDESVYELGFNYECWDYMQSSNYATYIGKSAESSAQLTKVADLPLSVYSPAAQTQEVVVTEGGKYNLSWAAQATESAYVSYSVGNVSLHRVTSAKAPYTVENLSIANDATGALKATISFNAPSKDYAGRELASDGVSRIDIYRGESSSIPVKTFENPKPGESLTWIDEEALQGNNTYMIVPINADGRGKAVTSSVFVGFDVPMAVGELSITPDATNQIPTLTWTAPEKGVNGGVVDTNTLVYNVCSYDPTKTGNDAVKILGQTKNLTFTVEDREPTDKQEIAYYAVITQTEQGIGGAVISFSLLGKPIELPFKESFAGAKFENEPWTLPETGSQALQWGVSDASTMANYGATPQDGDNGVAYFYNGNPYEVFDGTKLLSPKIAIGGKSALLSFYVWQGRATTYAQAPQITPMITIDESEYIKLGETIDLSQGEPGWVNYTYDLSEYKDAPCLSLVFDAYTSGYLDMIYLDNIQVTDKDGSVDGITDGSSQIAVFGVDGGIITRATGDNEIYVYNISGQLVDRFVADGSLRRADAGIYLVKVADRTFKVAVK